LSWAALEPAVAESEPTTMSSSRPLPRVPTSLEERRLVQSLLDVQRGSLDSALGAIEDLVRERPDFRLANLVYADLLAAHSQPLSRFGQLAPNGTVSEFMEEARARVDRYIKAPPVDLYPASLLRLSEETRAALLVDAGRYRMYLIENHPDGLRATRDYYVSIGKGGANKRFEGDEKTPVGVYVVDQYLPGSELPDEYGSGAYPISYPNEWDENRGRTGSGIWIHGTESESYSRAPKSSRGCVTLSNVDFESLASAVEIDKTPVLVVDEVDWVSQDDLAAERRDIMDQIANWERDWESLDTEAYLEHYSSSFRSDGMSRDRFADHKRRVNQSKRYVRVEIDDLGIYRYPGEEAMVVVDFLQEYESNNFSSVVRKRQYWRREGVRWRIVLESSIDIS